MRTASIPDCRNPKSITDWPPVYALVRSCLQSWYSQTTPAPAPVRHLRDSRRSAGANGSYSSTLRLPLSKSNAWYTEELSPGQDCSDCAQMRAGTFSMRPFAMDFQLVFCCTVFHITAYALTEL